MSKVQLLPEALASQIAAGEVVERPASVVKELVENALDAEARAIFIDIEKSGKERIRVTDDGVGMDAEDAGLAMKRHATSKIRSAADLARIATLGFRGEALPSIASVSRFALRTRPSTRSAGYELIVEGGRTVREGEVGMAAGTIVDVRGLFFNMPARRKFLRSDVTESSHVAALVSNMAAAFPGVHFRLTHGKRTHLDAPPVASRHERLYQIEGSWVEQAVALEESTGSLGLQGWVSPPAASRGASSRLHLFVNRRPVKDRILTHAVLEAYREVSSKSGTPLVYLFLELAPEKIDVNVHPGKTEVRFVEQQFVHQAVFSTLRNALRGGGRVPDLVRPAPSGAPKVTAFAAESGPDYAGVRRVSRAGAGWAPGAGRLGSTGGGHEGLAMARAVYGVETQETRTGGFAEFPDVPPAVLGQFRESFIIAADGHAVWLVDQHAAHERILYEELVNRGGTEAERQLLLAPLPLELSPVERVTMEEELDRFGAFGFEVEPFGGESYLLRAVPAVLSGLDPERIIRATLAERERECRSSSVVEAQGRIAARLACHAAIKVNTELAREKMLFLLDRLWRADEPTVCPHGRPTTLKLSRDEVERSFGR